MRLFTSVYCAGHVPMCIGALVVLYLCMVAVVVVRAQTFHTHHEAFAFGETVPKVGTPAMPATSTMPTTSAMPTTSTPKLDTPAISTTRPKMLAVNSGASSGAAQGQRPRLIRSLQATPADGVNGKDGSMELQDASFSVPAQWMRTDAQYLMQDVLPVHKKLIQTKTLFNGDAYTVSPKDQCAVVRSTDALMGTHSLAMYQCAETALLRILPALNQPFKMKTTSPPTAIEEKKEEKE